MRNVLLILLLFASVATAIGCQDGPLFAVKSLNPYYRRQWAADERLGPTDAERARQLELLADRLPSMSADEQAGWAQHLEMLLEHDQSSQMRLLAVRAAVGIDGLGGEGLLRRGIEDEHPKVRMTACEMLGRRQDAAATQLLAETAGADTDDDVRMAAVRALGNHRGAPVNAALRAALEDRDPAMQLAAMEALRASTGVKIGDDAEAWLAHLDGQPVPEEARPSVASRLRDLFY